MLGETMDDKQCKISVEVYGESYALKGNLEAERVKIIAALVDAKMREIAKTNAYLSPTKVAVLAALNIADDYLRLENDFNQLVQMVKDVK
jgi:cell division protein ZapA